MPLLLLLSLVLCKSQGTLALLLLTQDTLRLNFLFPRKNVRFVASVGEVALAKLVQVLILIFSPLLKFYYVAVNRKSLW